MKSTKASQSDAVVEPIARGIASRLAEAFGRVTVVTAGVHDDNLDADGIAIYLRLGEELADELVRQITEGEMEFG